MDGGGVSTSTQPSLHPYQNRFLRHRNSSILKLHQHQPPPSSDTSSVTTSSSSSSSSASSSSSSTSTSSGDFDLISIKPVSYTSLKDLLPTAAVNSPKPKSPAQNQVQSGTEISIKNRLVKQAAWAYLQPMSTSEDSSSGNFLHRVWNQFVSKNPVSALFRFLDRHIFGRLNRAFDWLLRSLTVRSSR